ncbi:MAG TPA: cyclodeaminase/cyclohydrolase family protein, partial [Solirubrobacteraceae bacterium]|nr:cyclodeaminase/cyclohydrolase family protein [Solirubrobacteraceae bacterium]
MRELALDELLERVAAPAPTPGAGPVAAWTCALAAGLVEMACAVEARRGDVDADTAHERRERARALRGELLELADRDVVAYAEVL